MAVEPRIVEKGRMILVGFSFFGDPFAESGGWTEENEIGSLWSRFSNYLADHRDQIKHVEDDDAAYEVHVESEETTSKGHREVFVGIEVNQLDNVPVELLVKVLPPTTYVVFTLQGEQIISDWSLMIAEWMLDADYVPSHTYGFQLYDRRFKGLDNLEGSELDVYVPVIPAEDAGDVSTSRHR
jgi:AraC family transcriptional regulator